MNKNMSHATTNNISFLSYFIASDFFVSYCSKNIS